MKFGHLIQREMAASPAEWGPFWLNYKLLKKKIKSMKTAVKDHLPSDTTPEALSNSQSEVEFFRLMDYEIRRGAQFLSLAEGQYVLKTRTVLDGCRTTQHLLQSPMLGLDSMLTPAAVTAMWIRLLQACISVYTELLLLNHWVVMSYCGFTKILKKHDRWTGFMTKEKYLRSVVAKQHFTSYPRLHRMIQDMETLYMNIAKHIPECPEGVAAHAKIVAVKKSVSSAAKDFSKYTSELTRVVLGGAGGAATSGSTAIDDNNNRDGEADEAGTGSSSDNAGPEPTRPPTRVIRDSTKVNRKHATPVETATTEACSNSSSSSSGGGGANEGNESGSACENNGGPGAKRKRLSGFTVTTRVSAGSVAASNEYNRAEIGKLTAGLPWAGNARRKAGNPAAASGTCGGGGRGNASICAQGCGNDDSTGAGGEGAAEDGTGSDCEAVGLLQQLVRDSVADEDGREPGRPAKGDAERELC